MQLTTDEADMVLWGLTLAIVKYQGRHKKWRAQVSEHIELGSKLSSLFEETLGADTGWFERILSDKLGQEILDLYSTELGHWSGEGALGRLTN